VKIRGALKDIYLIIYGLIRYAFLALFLYFTLIKNPVSVLYFPVNIYHFVRNAFAGIPFSLYDFRKLLIPFIFYYMAYGFVSGRIKKERNKRKFKN
jgi:putative peptide zinc metalloprotease protein